MRNLRTFGLTMLAVLAISAAAASAAHADTELIPSEYPAIITGELASTAEHPEHVFSIGTLGTMKCQKANLTGTVKKADKHTELTVTPSYGECFLNGNPATVTMNGCDFLIKFTGTLDIVCTTDPKHIIIDVWESMEGHLNGDETTCKFTIGPQAGLKNLGFTSTTPGGLKKDVDVTFGIANIAIKRIQGMAPECGPEDPVGGASYTGLTTLKAYEDNNGKEGNQLDLTV